MDHGDPYRQVSLYIHAYAVYGFTVLVFVASGLKKFSDWPTYPQLYVKGELVGGLDIVKVSARRDLACSLTLPNWYTGVGRLKV